MTAKLTMIISLIISLASAYCTVVGMGNVFVSAVGVTMFIASVIELGRVILLYDLHHYWDKLKLYQKIPGLGMLLITTCLSAMGVFGFLSNAHSHRMQEVIPIQMEIDSKQQEIQLLEKAININNIQLNQYNSNAINKYTEMGYVTKAVNLQKEQQKATNLLYDDNRIKQEQINKINKEILDLQLQAEKTSPTIAHLKYYAKLFNVDDETAIIIFIVMIMTVFDTLAMYLMITSDWISKLESKSSNKLDNEIIENNTENNAENNIDIQIDYNQIIDNINKEIRNNFDNIKIPKNNNEEIINYLKQNTDYQLENINNTLNLNNKNILNKLNEEFIKIRNNMNDDNLIEKLNQIENNVKQIYVDNQNFLEQKNHKNIDNDLQKMIDLINEDSSHLNKSSVKNYIIENNMLDDLKKYFCNNKKIMLILNKL